MARFRELKQRVREALNSPDWRARLPELDSVPARQLPGPLFSLLLDPVELVRWRAAEAFGRAVARMAETDGMEPARVVLRQCLWRLNEESGGVGWGVPEALGETLSRNARLAREFHRVLASYVRVEKCGEGNCLDHVPLRRGVYWALGRLAGAFPELVRPEIETLLAGLKEDDAPCRGLAALALGILGAGEAAQALSALRADHAALMLYRDDMLSESTVSALANEALGRLAQATPRAFPC